jgi:hypothetical protein
VPTDAVACFDVGNPRRTVEHGVDLVAAGGEAAGDLEDVDAPAGAAGDDLVRSDVEDPHEA